MVTFYFNTLSRFYSLYFFTLTWVKRLSWYFYQSIFKLKYQYFYLSNERVYFWHHSKYYAKWGSITGANTELAKTDAA